MNPALVATGIFGGLGAIAAALAVVNERRMQRHRQPGVTYGQVTFRRDGAWRRTNLFTPEGLRYQRRAARYGFIAAGCWLLGGAALLIGAIA
jgi:hypothetical protein